MLLDPEIDERVDGKSKLIRLKGGSSAGARPPTPEPRSRARRITSSSSTSARTPTSRWSASRSTRCSPSTPGPSSRSARPAITRATSTRPSTSTSGGRPTGVPARTTSSTTTGSSAKYNPAYARFIAKEKMRLGEDSEEFQMSYALKWQLDRGMLITEDDLDYLADPSMQLVQGWTPHPVRRGHRPGAGQGLHRRHGDVGGLGLPRPGWLPRAPHPQLAGDPQHRVGGAVLRDHGLPRRLRHRLRGGRCPGHGQCRGRPVPAADGLPVRGDRLLLRLQEPERALEAPDPVDPAQDVRLPRPLQGPPHQGVAAVPPADGRTPRR